MDCIETYPDYGRMLDSCEYVVPVPLAFLVPRRYCGCRGSRVVVIERGGSRLFGRETKVGSA